LGSAFRHLDYRSGLYTRLTNAGYNFQFVGASPEPWNGHSGDPTNGGAYSQRVEVRRRDVFAIVESDIAIAHVVANNEQNVRLAALVRCFGGDGDGGGCQQARKDEECRFYLICLVS
jgi:hypothetical protein